MSRTALLIFCAVCLGVLLAFVAWVSPDFSEARLQQAVVAGAFLAAGWIVTFAFREAGILAERRQKRDDLMLALRAEIFDYSEMLRDEFDSEITALEHAVATDPDYHPFFPMVSDPVIFQALSADAHMLPVRVIDDVIQFYSMLSDLALMVEDLRSDEAKQLPPARRLPMYLDYIEMRRAASELAEISVRALSLSNGMEIDRGTDDPVDLERRKSDLKQWLNSQNAAHDGH